MFKDMQPSHCTKQGYYLGAAWIVAALLMHLLTLNLCWVYFPTTWILTFAHTVLNHLKYTVLIIPNIRTA